MAGIAGIPQNFNVSQGNRQVALSWDIVAGATGYDVYRSFDGVTFTSYALTGVNQFLDIEVIVGVKYWYQVASINASGTSSPCPSQMVIPAPDAELSLYEIRQRAKERANREDSNFVTQTEWNFFINQAMYELYDMLITVYEDYFQAPEIVFYSNGSSYLYPLPDGVLTFTDSISGNTIVAPPFYKMLGIDLGLNNANNAYVTMNKYNLIDRNRFVYPNTASTIYGVFNLQYRIMGKNIRFIPTPSAGQPIRLLYVPRLPTLLQDTDLSTIGFSGWLQYVIVRAAKYALDKEESDTSSLDEELLFLKTRIEESAPNKDAGQPDTVSDTRQGNWSDGWGGGRNGSIGGW